MITNEDIDKYPVNEQKTKTRKLLVALEYERRMEAEINAAHASHRLTCSEHKLMSDMAKESFGGYTTIRGVYKAINDVAPELISSKNG